MSSSKQPLNEVRDVEKPGQTWGVNFRECNMNEKQLIDIWFNSEAGGERVSRAMYVEDLERLLNIRLNEEE